MNKYRFYAEMPDARSSKAASKQWGAFTRKALTNDANHGYHSNVVAVPLDERGQPLWQGATQMMDVFSAIHGTANSPVHGSSASREYLRKRCVHISEDLARRLHPALFTYLEQP